MVAYASRSEEQSRAAHLDQLLDDALQATFPASDPIALSFEQLDLAQARGSTRDNARVVNR
jgi:hypothetical protein